MSRILVAIILSLLVSCALASGGSADISSDTYLGIKTGGGITGPFFAVSLSSSGELSVKKESLPFADTESGLTTVTYTAQLSPDEIRQLITLAASVDDFSDGCGLVGHGTSARMWLTDAGESKKFSCDNAPKWPIGANTSRLMQRLNSHLPDHLQVF